MKARRGNAERPRALARAARGERRGVALILVLGAIAVLSVLLTEFQDETSAELASAVSDRDALKAEYLARSAINLSRLLIAAEPTIRKGLTLLFLGRTPPQVPVWDFSDRILGAFNDKEGGAGFAALTNTDLSQGKNLGVEGGHFEVVIVDEDSKIDVNLAANGNVISKLRLAAQLNSLTAGDQYNPLFEQRDRDDQFTDKLTLCSAVIDWADFDDIQFSCDPRTSANQQSTANEDSFYQLLKTPYRRKNAAFDSLEELHLVRGFGEDFWATFVDPEPENPRKRVLTVWGQGAVNVNTANPQTLLALICSGAAPPGTAAPTPPPGAPGAPPAPTAAAGSTGSGNLSNTSTMCSDPLEAQRFLMAVNLIQGFTAGAPIFTSAGDFIKTMKGQPPLGTILSTLKINPITFKSETDAAKALTTESKMFSIYADGVVPGYQRKTKVRIHEVVDFRNAPPPGAGPIPPGGLSADGGVPAVPPAVPLPGTAGANSPTGNTNAIAGALLPNPAGTVIYFRME